MNFQELMYLARSYGKNLPNYIQTPSPEEHAKQFNIALHWIGRFIQCSDPQISWNLEANRQKYPLMNTAYFGKLITRPLRAYINGREMTDYTGFNRVIGIGELDDRGQWRNASAGTPCIAAWDSRNELILDVPPTQAIVALGGHAVYGEYLPGAIAANGAYLPTGFATVFSNDNPTAAAVVKSVGTTAIPDWSDDLAGGTLAGASADGGTEATFDLPAIKTGLGPSVGVFHNFAFAIPDGATITFVRIKTLKVSSTSGASVIFNWRADATLEAGANLQSQAIAFAPGTTLADVGPLPEVMGVSGAMLNESVFGLQMVVDQPPYVGPFEPAAVDVDLQIDHLQLEAAYSIPGGGSGTVLSEADAFECVPDLEYDLHPLVAYVSVMLSANPGANTNEVIASLQSIRNDLLEYLRAQRTHNRQANAGLLADNRSNERDTFWVGR